MYTAVKIFYSTCILTKLLTACVYYIHTKISKIACDISFSTVSSLQCALIYGYLVKYDSRYCHYTFINFNLF